MGYDADNARTCKGENVQKRVQTLTNAPRNSLSAFVLVLVIVIVIVIVISHRVHNTKLYEMQDAGADC